MPEPDKHRRPRGQAWRATRRLSEMPLQRNLVIRCSDMLYEAAKVVASAHSVTLSDYVRELIIQDVTREDSPPN